MKSDLQARIDQNVGIVSEGSGPSLGLGFYPGSPHAKVADRRPSFEIRQMSIREALEWAFGTELAALDFDEWARAGVGIEFVLMQRAMVGTVDTSIGRSCPASDAELIGDAVRTALDWRDAVWVAELARSCRCPDWFENVKQVYVPRSWSHGSGGRIGTKINANDERQRIELGYDKKKLWRRWRKSRKTGAMTLQPCYVTPVTLHPSPAKIAQVRRTYQRWCGLLLKVYLQLKSVELSRVEITDSLPNTVPWLGEDREVLTE